MVFNDFDKIDIKQIETALRCDEVIVEDTVVEAVDGNDYSCIDFHDI